MVEELQWGQEISQWFHHEGLICRPIAPWANALHWSACCSDTTGVQRCPSWEQSLTYLKRFHWPTPGVRTVHWDACWGHRVDESPSCLRSAASVRAHSQKSGPAIWDQPHQWGHILRRVAQLAEISCISEGTFSEEWCSCLRSAASVRAHSLKRAQSSEISHVSEGTFSEEWPSCLRSVASVRAHSQKSGPAVWDQLHQWGHILWRVAQLSEISCISEGTFSEEWPSWLTSVASVRAHSQKSGPAVWDQLHQWGHILWRVAQLADISRISEGTFSEEWPSCLRSAASVRAHFQKSGPAIRDHPSQQGHILLTMSHVYITGFWTANVSQKLISINFILFTILKLMIWLIIYIFYMHSFDPINDKIIFLFVAVTCCNIHIIYLKYFVYHLLKSL